MSRAVLASFPGAGNAREGGGVVVVREATTEAERMGIYRLRYDVYIDEMGGATRHPEADTVSRVLRDEYDDYARQLYAVQDGLIVGCVRLNIGRDGPIECGDLLEVDRFAPAFPNRVAGASRFAIRASARGIAVTLHLMTAAYCFAGQEGVQFLFCDCHPRLVPLYSRGGFRPYRPGFTHPKYVWVVPLVLVVDDLAFLESVRSPVAMAARRFANGTEGRDILLRAFPAAATMLVPANQDEEALSTVTRSTKGQVRPVATAPPSLVTDGA